MTILKFRKHGDLASADLLELVIYPEEVTHVAAGLRWFTHLHERGDHVLLQGGEGGAVTGGAGAAEGGAGAGAAAGVDASPGESLEGDEGAVEGSKRGVDASSGGGMEGGERGVEGKRGVDAVVGAPPGTGLVERFHAICRQGLTLVPIAARLELLRAQCNPT